MSNVVVFVDAGYGDQGKGSMVDAYVRRSNAHTVFRFNGGPQALHHVVTPDGRLHGFSQFGSGTFVPGVRTFLTHHMLVNPSLLLEEDDALQKVGVSDAFARLTIDGRCPLVTPFHRAANWLRELERGGNAHGTCGMGISELMMDLLAGHEDVLRMKDIRDTRKMSVSLRATRERLREQFKELLEREAGTAHERIALAIRVFSDPFILENFLERCRIVAAQTKIAGEGDFAKRIAEPGTTVGEGAQGVGLDEWHGFHPNTTWSTTTFENADSLLREAAFAGDYKKVCILRAYATRHGAGLLVTKDAELTASIPEHHNSNNGWQGDFRVGWFDAVTARYALDVVGDIDGMAITCLDRIENRKTMQICTGYLKPGGGMTRQIKAHFDHDLERQGKLTEQLFRCAPFYERDIPQAEYLDRLQAILRVPFAALSRGPSANEKTFFAPL